MIPELNGVFEKKKGMYCLPREIFVLNKDFCDWCTEAFYIRSGYRLSLTERPAEIKIVEDDTLQEEGYRMSVTDAGIVIHASKEVGVIWAFTTLYSLMDNRGQIGCCYIEDEPKYRHRGLLLDCARHFFSTEEIKKIIEEISRVKMNVLHWHLADDQGFRIESKRYPKLHEQCGDAYYTQKEIKEIVEFACVRGVEIIPEIDMPGHTTAILAAYPEFSCHGTQVTLAKTGGIYPITLCPGHGKTYVFLKDLLEEVCGLFPSKWFHIGGDEAPDREWLSCEHCRNKMQMEQLVNTRLLQGYFSKQVITILKKYHKSIICWNDSLEASNFPWQDENPGDAYEEQNTQIQYWNIQYADSMQEYIKNGGRFIYSDMFELYFDYPCSMSSIEKVYNSKPAIRKNDYSKEDSNLSGIEGCLWTEHITTDQQLEERLFPRVYALAENAWSRKLDYTDFQGRLEVLIASAQERGVHCLSLEEANPTGEEKKKGIMEYTAIMQSGIPDEIREVILEFSKPNKEFNDRFMKEFFGIEGP